MADSDWIIQHTMDLPRHQRRRMYLDGKDRWTAMPMDAKRYADKKQAQAAMTRIAGFTHILSDDLTILQFRDLWD